jgi:hypothetical protein
MIAEDEKVEVTSPLEQTCLLLGSGLLGGGSSLFGLNGLGHPLWLRRLDDTASLGLGQLNGRLLLRDGRSLY